MATMRAAQGGINKTLRRFTIPEVLVRYDPPETCPAAPVVFDSPHSGTVYPADFGYAAPFEILRRAEDAFVDELFADAPHHGASLLAALFPRSYIDPNRHESEVDLTLFAEPWPHPVMPSERAERGLGLIRRLVRPDTPVYDRRLTVAEVESRIARFHRPYHAELKAMLDRAHGTFGAVWHVNCHSMKALGRGPIPRRHQPRKDFVLSDRDGTTCSADFTEMVRRTLVDLGYSVAVNHPFKGAELVARNGDPAGNRHSLQIEVNRGLYMDERRVEKTPGFDALKADINRLIAAIADYARSEAANGACSGR
jgi:N-formylglutamate amidohydrolase